ncbi:MAG: hypothetical protein HC855_11515 [Rhizobiales bacterium]|nr:hypothetical protein [Hyphomicrobiales bacterium]
MKSIADLRDQHEAALAALADEEAELRKVELLMEKESAMVQTALPVAHGENGFAHAR